MTRWFTQGALRTLKKMASAKRNPLVVEHVRYVKKPVIDPVTKAIAMARSMGRDDLIERLER